jgi:hypothetical protein
VWQQAVRDCLLGEVTYIGTSAMVGWHESTVFSSAFYGAPFHNQGYGKTPAERAIEAYIILTDRSCPHKVMPLTPIRNAKTAFV